MPETYLVGSAHPTGTSFWYRRRLCLEKVLYLGKAQDRTFRKSWLIMQSPPVFALLAETSVSRLFLTLRTSPQSQIESESD